MNPDQLNSLVNDQQLSSGFSTTGTLGVNYNPESEVGKIIKEGSIYDKKYEYGSTMSGRGMYPAAQNKVSYILNRVNNADNDLNIMAMNEYYNSLANAAGAAKAEKDIRSNESQRK